MIVQTYILGFLIRFGPQHGYRLKQLLSENAADFTRIKLPTIYYHLEKMQQTGLVTVSEEREGHKPERAVYEITEAGRKEFERLLIMLLNHPCEFVFEQDAVLYFHEALQTEVVIASLTKQKEKTERIIEHIEEHQTEALPHMALEFQKKAQLIFAHHLLHYQAELKWIQNAIEVFQE